jgi:hypothetical protein
MKVANQKSKPLIVKVAQDGSDVYDNASFLFTLYVW